MKRLHVCHSKTHSHDGPGRRLPIPRGHRRWQVVSVGTLENLQPWLRRYPHDIDDTFANDILLPGFIDPHTHLRCRHLHGFELRRADSVKPTAEPAGTNAS
ncbi:MAG: hypothetical protein R3E84_12790 [Pseudomonadales bacterium]